MAELLGLGWAKPGMLHRQMAIIIHKVSSTGRSLERVYFAVSDSLI